jgi:hypothetical protein
MKNFAKLIHKSNITYLPTNLPVQFYGLPDGKVNVIYARFYQIKFDRSDLEFILAEHQEFYYNYVDEKLFQLGSSETQPPVYSEMVDKINPKIKILKVNREFNSFAEAFVQLNKKAKDLLLNKPEVIKIIPNKGNQNQLSIA